MSRRSRAREIVLQVLYQNELNPEQPDFVRTRFVEARLGHNDKLVAFARSLIDGVRMKRETLDRQLEKTAMNWRLSRMAATDRNVLRLGAYELLFTDAPGRVVINEAIVLARRYGSDNSSSFVNGVLDKLMKLQAKGELEERDEAATTDKETQED
ncbi:transcription antitermination factor NusB [Mariniblastus fucicola]|uniref:Transcription antitermination protein NusB n=1 Tax=Mariniblastus fucicola TaxID=980251 RepID=A0A5B9PGA9_9BACT|nr:transcription antitermination factor NusB [Mariniblastus fucicola]QEG24265.1 hypothetical protein MFFC18_41830 [Mariniblastus fucicola]